MDVVCSSKDDAMMSELLHVVNGTRASHLVWQTSMAADPCLDFDSFCTYSLMAGADDAKGAPSFSTCRILSTDALLDLAEGFDAEPAAKRRRAVPTSLSDAPDLHVGDVLRRQLFRLWSVGGAGSAFEETLLADMSRHCLDGVVGNATLIGYCFREWWLQALALADVAALSRLASLLAAPAATAVADGTGQCALHTLAGRLDVYGRHRRSFQAMLSVLHPCCGNVNVRDKLGQTPLHVLCVSQRRPPRPGAVRALVEFLLEHRANVHDQWTPPALACQPGSDDHATQPLLTPLTLSAANICPDAALVFRRLVLAGANVHAPNGHGEAVLDVLLRSWRQMTILDAKDPAAQLLAFAAKVQLCLEQGAGVHVHGGRSLAALLFESKPLVTWAAEPALLALLELLFAFGADWAEPVLCEKSTAFEPLCFAPLQFLNQSLSLAPHAHRRSALWSSNDQLTFAITSGIAVARVLDAQRVATLRSLAMCASCSTHWGTRCRSTCQLFGCSGLLRLVASYTSLPVSADYRILLRFARLLD